MEIQLQENKEWACDFGYVFSSEAQKVLHPRCLWLLRDVSRVVIFFWSRTSPKYLCWNYSQGNYGVKKVKVMEEADGRSVKRREAEARKISSSFFCSFLLEACLHKKEMFKWLTVTVAINEAVTKICQLFTSYLLLLDINN